MSRLVSAFALLPLLLGCTDDSPTGADSPVVFETIVHTSTSGLTQSEQRVVRNQTDWVRLWDQLYAGVSPKPPLPRVDFGQEVVLVAAMGERPNSCYGVEVVEVRLRDGRLSVRIAETHTVGCACLEFISRPVHVVRVRLVLPGIDFRVEERTANC